MTAPRIVPKVDPVFTALLKMERIPLPEPEFRFRPMRKWRFDYAWIPWKVALEIDGGIWTAGRHTRGAGWLKDTEKLNEAAALGWRLLRTTPKGLHDFATIRLIARTLSLESTT